MHRVPKRIAFAILLVCLSGGMTTAISATRAEPTQINEQPTKVSALDEVANVEVKKVIHEVILDRQAAQREHAKSEAEHEERVDKLGKLKEESKSWILRLKDAKTQSEYETILSGYQELVKRYSKEFKGCLPPPPPAPLKKELSPTESRCHEGFRIGWKHGKQWAIIISSDEEKYEEGLKRMSCIQSFLKTKTESIFSICAQKGADQGYEKWWYLRNHKDELEKYVTEKRLQESAAFENMDYYRQVMKRLAIN